VALEGEPSGEEDERREKDRVGEKPAQKNSAANDDIRRAIGDQVFGEIANMPHRVGVGIVLVARKGKNAVASIETRRQAAADITAARNRRKIINSFDSDVLMQSLQRAETCRSRANPSARQSEAGERRLRAVAAAAPARLRCAIFHLRSARVDVRSLGGKEPALEFLLGKGGGEAR
jgi:hypothetical protein